MDNLKKIMYVIQKFKLDMHLIHKRDKVETSAYLKYNFVTRSRIDEIKKYENEFQSILGENIWIESKNGYISIVIPKKNPDIYPFKKIVESDFYKNYPGVLKVSLGENPDGAMVIGDIEQWVNVLIAGVPRYGKSNLLNVFINCLLMQNDNLVNLVIFDLKEGVELQKYNGIPHLKRPVITDINGAKYELTLIITEMKRRYEILKDNNCTTIQEYNKKIGGMPYLVVFIDELSELMLDKEKETFENQLYRIASRGSAAGIHLVVATQKPESEIISTKIKSKIITRISFKLPNYNDSHVILGESGAEKLKTRGDMLLKDDDGLTRIRACYISKEEIEQNISNLDRITYTERDIEKLNYRQMDNENIIDGEFEEIESDEEEFNRLYKMAVEYVGVNGECNMNQLRAHLHKHQFYVEKIIEELIKNKIITPYKTGKVYKKYEGE